MLVYYGLLRHKIFITMWSLTYISKLNGDGVDNHGKIPIFIVLWVDYDKNEAGQLRLTFRLVSFTIV